MAVKIKLKRMGKIRHPQYRVIVADARTKRDGRAIEEIGKYHPKENPSLIEIDSDRAQYWLSVGAQPTDPVLALFKVTGDWQKFKGLPGAEGSLETAAPKADKGEAFNKVLAEVHGESGAEAATEKKAKKAAKPKESAKAAEGKAAEGKAAEGKAAEGKAAEGKAPATAEEKSPETSEASERA